MNINNKNTTPHSPPKLGGEERSSEVVLTRGFTLMEILVAMAIMAILAGVGFASYSSSLQRSRDAQRKAGLEQLQKALESFIADNGVYPQASVNKRIYDDISGADYAWGGSFDYEVRGTTVQYMKQLPKDPDTLRAYQYYVSTDRKKYVLYAALENSNDPAIVADLGVDCGSSPCNYLAMSSNLADPAALNQ